MSPAISFEASAINSHPNRSVYTRPAKKPKMSITQTYFLAHSARGKLSKEASRPDHDLRLLVGHANMLDSLMIDLANAEQEQERWFNQSLNGAIPAETEQEDDEEEEETPEDLAVNNADQDWDIEDAENIDDDSDDESLTLTRTISRSKHQSPTNSPPELLIDSESDSDDEMMPSSPPDETILLSEKQRQAIATTSYYDVKDASLSATDAKTLEQDGFFIPSRSRTTLVAAY